MSDAVSRALADAFPDRAVAAIDEQTTRPGNETAFVRFDDGDPCYVKTATDTNARLRREIAVTRYAGANCSTGVPEVIAADARADVPYLVTAPLPGTIFNDPWTDGADRAPLVRELGRAVAGVHEARFDRPGLIVGGDAEALELATDRWTEVLCATVEGRVESWFPDRFADLPGRLTETIRACEPTLDGVAPTLLHTDPSRINLHLEPTGLLDWERALVGDPGFGLAEAEFHHLGQPDVDQNDERERLTRALYEGYREVVGTVPPTLDRNRPLYRAISYLLVPQAFDDWTANAERPLDDLEAEVREEFENRMATAREAMV